MITILYIHVEEISYFPLHLHNTLNKQKIPAWQGFFVWVCLSCGVKNQRYNIVWRMWFIRTKIARFINKDTKLSHYQLHKIQKSGGVTPRRGGTRSFRPAPANDFSHRLLQTLQLLKVFASRKN